MDTKEIPTAYGSRPVTYFGIKATEPGSENSIMDAVLGIKAPWHIRAEEALRKARCGIFGHQMVKQKWHREDDHGEGPWEWHIGCLRCSKFRTEPGETSP